MVHASRPLLLSVAAFTLLGAGCIGGPASAPAADPEAMPHDHMRMVGGVFHMDAQGCEESGWIAMYSMPTPTKLAGVWEQTDIRQEYGNPTHDSTYTPSPLLFPQSGNIHMGFRCASATVDGVTVKDVGFGAILQQIKAPAWDPGGADRHLLISGISFMNGTIGDAIRATTTADITHTDYTCTLWGIGPEDLPGRIQNCPPTFQGVNTPRSLPRSYAYTVYRDHEKGVYQSWGPMAKYRDVPDRVTRFWWQVPADGSDAHIWSADEHAHDGMEQSPDMKWNPVYWDMAAAGGGEWTTPPEGVGELGDHNMGIPTGEHGPPFTQPLQQVYYEHPTLSFTSGQVIRDVTLDKIWMH